MKAWHREDIFAALADGGWHDAAPSPDDCFFVGEAYIMRKGMATLRIAFLSDVGTGCRGVSSLEEVVAETANHGQHKLWLRRRRDSQWKAELAAWVREVDRLT